IAGVGWTRPGSSMTTPRRTLTDPVIDRPGRPVDDPYVETYWLPILSPPREGVPEHATGASPCSRAGIPRSSCWLDGRAASLRVKCRSVRADSGPRTSFRRDVLHCGPDRRSASSAGLSAAGLVLRFQQLPHGLGRGFELLLRDAEDDGLRQLEEAAGLSPVQPRDLRAGTFGLEGVGDLEVEGPGDGLAREPLVQLVVEDLP